ncbi:DUF5615 family PIN-like protein [Planctomycetota bacterium]
MRLLLDMGISPRTAGSLRDLGHDVVHLVDEGLERLPDDRVLQKARDEKRVLITHDLDFGALVAASGAVLPSVITLRLRNMHPDRVSPRLGDVLDARSDTLLSGAVLTVTEAITRVRVLPVSGGR